MKANKAPAHEIPTNQSNLYHVKVGKPFVLPDNSIVNIEERVQLYDVNTFRSLLKRDAFKGYSVDILHDPTIKAVEEAPKRTRSRKTDDN